MPELPEVETVVRGLNRKLTGRSISAIEVFRPGTVIWNGDTRDKDLGKVLNVSRRGKYILINMESGTIVVHLRMTGKLTLSKGEFKQQKHDRAKIVFTDGKSLVFNDIRTFGKIEIYDDGVEPDFLKTIGVEPLGKLFDENYLLTIIKKKKAPIKNILLNQGLIAGLGNIYVAEILYRAGVNPTRVGLSLTKKEIAKIVKHTKEILKEAIENGGTTISDYRDSDDRRGSFQNKLAVYGQKKCICGEDIVKIKQAGRSTYYCKKCQK